MPIPWAALLTHGPTIVAAAERLLAGTKAAKTAPKADVRTDITGGRLDALEQSAEASARLLQDIARQLQAIGVAQEAVARRTAAAVKLGVAATVLAAAAVVVALVW